ncbi:hypothetical protein [Alkalicoccobacillus murimartini]|uniref:Uncharacterized protein n=1 Tax=Alkalicoccobacillus murimartini TaxID=171685 RepID=A0ABT9YIT0_9BACI|nr:hypothetical protein [Alkalicoccobacillus murimartini]MDQ0207772.1 hypothetical protein [Alkalicoccobacillus murimartini]
MKSLVKMGLTFTIVGVLAFSFNDVTFSSIAYEFTILGGSPSVMLPPN